MITSKNIFLVTLLPLLLLACKVNRDISMPEPALPVHFRNAIPDTSESIAEIRWKDFFTEPTLQKLIDSAIANNTDMQLALKNIERAQLQLNQTRWAYLPDARLQVAGVSNRPSENSINGLSTKSFLQSSHIEDYAAQVSISWEADLWGKISNQKSAALASYLQTAEARKWVQTNIVANVAEGFFNLLMLDAQINVAKRNIDLGDSTLRIIKLQFNSGQVTALAVQQAQEKQLAASALLPELEKEIILQENALQILTGALPDRIHRSALLNEATISDRLSAGVPTELVSRRPDVRNYELQLIRSNSEVGIARANMYPSLTITASGGLNSFLASNWFNIPASLFGLVAGGITQPLFQKKQLKTTYEVAMIEREKTVINFRQSVLNAVGEVSDALARIEKLQTSRSIAQSRVKNLREAIVNANLLFATGMANYLEVITAQNNALQSELEMAAITKDLLSAKVELYRSLGGGWK